MKQKQKEDEEEWKIKADDAVDEMPKALSN